ncbi:unnamed protein product [Paramecium octaurelia]|uniref:Uncharacterized protein n=1 Tax=Paramecium octaurelia TaxID=43137 RepID=A0A8S1YN85_PAROT|nr:unnamed protein product [Paramecium octaurelia]
MQQINPITIKCPNSEHANDVKLLFFNESFSVNRLYCIQCMRDRIHVSHPQINKNYQFYWNLLKKFIKNVIIALLVQINKWILVYQQFYVFIDGIRSKYLKIKQQFQYFDSKQMNSFFAGAIQFKSFQKQLKLKYNNRLRNSKVKCKSLHLIYNYTSFNQFYKILLQIKINLGQTIIQYLIQIFRSHKNYMKKELINLIRLLINILG